MLRNNPVGAALVSLLFVLALFTCWSSVRHFFTTQELYGLRGRYQSLQRTLAGVESLYRETLVYSQRNPAIDPLLLELGMKVKASSVGPSVPGPVR